MITLKDFMEVTSHRITGGSEYGWQCFGHNSRWLDAEGETYSASVVFDCFNFTVFVAEVCDSQNSRAYRWLHPDYKKAHDAEAKERGVDGDQAWDEVKYIDLETEEDFLEKCAAIVAGQSYDTRVQVPINFTDEELLKYMKLAHERDMTFNALVEEALREAIAQHKAGTLTQDDAKRFLDDEYSEI